MHLCGKTFAMISAFRHVPESTISFLFNQFLKTQTVRILEAAGHNLVASITLVLRQCSWHVVNTLDIDTMSIVCDVDCAYTVQSPKWAKIKRIQKFNSFQLSAGFIFLGCIYSTSGCGTGIPSSIREGRLIKHTEYRFYARSGVLTYTLLKMRVLCGKL